MEKFITILLTYGHLIQGRFLTMINVKTINVCVCFITNYLLSSLIIKFKELLQGN